MRSSSTEIGLLLLAKRPDTVGAGTEGLAGELFVIGFPGMLGDDGPRQRVI